MKLSIRQSLPTWINVACLFFLLAALILKQTPALAGYLQTTPISFGSTTSGSINQPGEIDSYTFTANSGDYVLIGISRVSGDLWPGVRLYNPDGALLLDKSNPVHVEISQELRNLHKVYLPLSIRGLANSPDRNTAAPSPHLSIVANVPGTYTILVSDGFNGTKTGSYNLFLQKLNPPVGANNISYSQIISGSINQPAEMDAFIFSSAMGDKLIIGMSQVSGNMWQQLRLYDPNGVLLHEVKHPVHTEIIYDIQNTGDYVLLASDGFNGIYTGSYNIYLQRRVNPTNATVITFGQTTAGSINQPAEMDSFTFSAKANDQIRVLMTSISGDLWQQIRLYDPAGTLLNENTGVNQAEITRVLPVDGDYTILASDGFNGTKTGSYNISLQKLP